MLKLELNELEAIKDVLEEYKALYGFNYKVQENALNKIVDEVRRGEIMMQKHTSKQTSINKTKLPSIYKKVELEKGKVLLDFGCGRYIDHIKEYVVNKGLKYIPYDPYNLPNSQLPQMVDITICSNVFNVIDDLAAIKKAFIEMYNITQEYIYISIYEGDKSGIGRETKKDCWQRNETLQTYLEYIHSWGFPKATIKKGVIVVDVH